MQPERLRIAALVGPAADWNALVQDMFDGGAETVVVLGPGLTPADGALAALCAVRSTNRQAVLGGNIVDTERPHSIEHAGFWWDESALEWRRERYIEFISDPAAAPYRPAKWLGGAPLLIPREVWERIGGFDIRFGEFLADVDWCLRARGAGFACFSVRDALFASDRPAESLDVQSEATRLRSTLLLARKHSVPYGVLTLATRRMLAQVGGELGRVEFWADYGVRIGILRRSFWFLRNASQAMRRERLRTDLRQTIRDTCSLLFRNDVREVG